jgi:hypothetical protein
VFCTLTETPSKVVKISGDISRCQDYANSERKCPRIIVFGASEWEITVPRRQKTPLTRHFQRLRVPRGHDADHLNRSRRSDNWLEWTLEFPQFNFKALQGNLEAGDPRKPLLKINGTRDEGTPRMSILQGWAMLGPMLGAEERPKHELDGLELRPG